MKPSYLGGFITHLFQFECVLGSLSIKHQEMNFTDRIGEIFFFLSEFRICLRQLDCNMEILRV